MRKSLEKVEFQKKAQETFQNKLKLEKGAELKKGSIMKNNDVKTKLKRPGAIHKQRTRMREERIKENLKFFFIEKIFGKKYLKNL